MTASVRRHTQEQVFKLLTQQYLHENLFHGVEEFKIVHCNSLEGLVDLVGIEPTTSSMPFPSTNCSGQIPSERERHRKAVFMQIWRVSAALRLYASDKVRTLATRAGIVRLRHKSRHSLTDPIEAGNTAGQLPTG